MPIAGAGCRCRAVRTRDSRLRPMMKSTAATMYAEMNEIS